MMNRTELVSKWCSGEITPDEMRQEFAELIAKNVAKMLRMKNVPEIKVQRLDFSEGGYCTRCGAEIVINRDQLDYAGFTLAAINADKDATISLKSCIKTICHEMRHAWQYEYGLYSFKGYISSNNKKLLYELKEKYGDEASSVLFEMYEAQPCEVDARYWAEKKIRELENGTLSVNDFLGE